MNGKIVKNKKTLLILTVIALVIVVAVTLASCSLFAKAVKSLDKAITSDTTQNDTSEQGETDTETGEYGSGSRNGGGSISTDPVKSDNVTISSSLVYDKASGTDFSVTATHENMSYNGIMGAGLTKARIGGSARLGHSDLIFDGEYLSTLDVGDYDFYLIVTDTKGEKHYAPFTFKVVNSKTRPTDVKINYDVDCPNVYVTYTCDCGTSHTVTFDDSACEVVEEGLALVKTSVNKSLKHSATVRCSNGGYTTITKAAPEAAAVSGGYFESGYSFMGHTADKYIEDDAEAIALFQYLIYSGESGEMKAYASPKVHTKVQSESAINAYLQSLQPYISNPWHVLYSMQSEGKILTFNVVLGEIDTISSGYVDGRAYEDNALISHYAALNVRLPGSELPIDKNATSVTVRNVKELLKAVEAGYKPNATGDALTYYNKAREFCYTYLTDEMTDMEKLHVIYDYLAGEIDYDYSALHLFNLVNSIYGVEFNAAKQAIAEALADEQNGFSTSMKAAIVAARDTATDADDLYEKLRVNYLQRLTSFSIEGVLDSKVAVCEGISYTFMLLARIEGIECYQISGYATNNGSSVSHAWNKVCLDGTYYCVDATWGNIYINNTRYVTHRYFMVSEDLFSQSHEEYVDGEVAVKNLALGDAEYFKSVKTAEGHTLYLSDYADMVAAVKYFSAAGLRYFEFMTDPDYADAAEGDFLKAYQKNVAPLSSYAPAGDGNLFIYYVYVK